MRMKIRSKIIASTALVVSVTLMLSGFFIYDYAKNIIREQSIKDSRTKLAQISFQLKKVQEQVTKTAEYIVSDEEIGSLVYAPPSPSLEENYFRKQAVQEKLKRFAALNHYIQNIIIVRPDQETFSNNSGYEDYFAEYLKQHWFADRIEDRSGFSVPHQFFYIGSNRQVFSYILKYRPIGDNISPYSYLVLDVAYSEIDNAFLQSAGDFERIQLTTGSGELLYESHSDLSSDDNAFMNAVSLSEGNFKEDAKRIALTDSSMNQGWNQVALLSKDRLFEKINRVFYFYILIILSAIGLSLIVMLPIILSLTKPLSRLTQAMKRVAVGDLNTSVSIHSGDELEILGTGFNRMVHDLKSHIESSIRDQDMRRKMQIDLLMAQINPHFLYNTLNTIIYLCHAGRNVQAAEMTQALIAILQDTIKTGDGAEFATLKEERRIVDKYAIIQQTRYPDRFRIDWQAEEQLWDSQIPRMLLQPLVENAILHGLFPSDREDGRITIRAYEAHNQILLEVEDNGVGMVENKESEILDLSLAVPERTRGIGLGNIRERIQFHYGSSYGVEIDSPDEQGTLIRIRIPLKSLE